MKIGNWCVVAACITFGMSAFPAEADCNQMSAKLQDGQPAHALDIVSYIQSCSTFANLGDGSASAGPGTTMPGVQFGPNPVYSLGVFQVGKSGGGNFGWGSPVLGVNTYYDFGSDSLKRFGGWGGDIDTAAVILSQDANNGQGAISFWTGDNGDPLNRLAILKNGNVGIGTTSPAYTLDVNGTVRAANISPTSDRRLKKDISPLVLEALAKIERLQPVTFRWIASKDDGMKGVQIGLVAQDVERVLPTTVTTANDRTKTKGIKYNEITVVLVKALQEEHAIVQQQSRQISEDHLLVQRQARQIAALTSRLDRIEKTRMAKAQ